MRQGEFRKQDLFKFVANLGVFCALEMDWPAFNVMNTTAMALLTEAGLLEEFIAFSQGMGLPAEHLMTVGRC
ncbi:MAG: hypothetical protein HGJ94_07795 [Desulfosarcina sp.]|nr:hypothetical protein [Desulfosarcina sp.]